MRFCLCNHHFPFDCIHIIRSQFYQIDRKAASKQKAVGKFKNLRDPLDTFMWRYDTRNNLFE